MLNSSHALKIITFALFTLAGVLRLEVAWYNLQANDNHYEVMERIENKLPTRLNNCWQCYQPKLYHYLGAQSFKITGIQSFDLRLRFLSLFNCIMGMITLWLLYKTLLLYPLSPFAQVLTFGLIALNPKFIYINAQVTNDSLIILISSALIYLLCRLFQKPTLAIAWGLAPLLFLAPIAKASGLPVALGAFFLLILFLLRSLKKHPIKKKGYWIAISAGLLLSLTSTLTLGSYLNNLEDTGNFLATNSHPKSAPSFFAEDFETSAGISSIFKGYFSFHPIGLIKTPYLIHGKTDAYEPRKSLWSQLYARFWSARYSQWPSTNFSRDPFVIHNSRALMILGLPFALIWIWGGIAFARETLRDIKRLNWKDPRFSHDWVFASFAVGFLLVITSLAYSYRDYNFIKVIYIFPALIPFALFFAKGIENLPRQKFRFFTPFLFLIFASFAFFSCTEASLLGHDLSLAYSDTASYGKFPPSAQQLNSRDICLSHLSPIASQQPWGHLKNNKAVDGKRIVVARQEYSCGLGTHAQSFVKYSLQKKYSKLRIGYGLNDTAEKSDGVVFEIYADGQQVHRSDIMSWREFHFTEVSLTGIDTLELRVDPLGSINSDHANWLNPFLEPIKEH